MGVGNVKGVSRLRLRRCVHSSNNGIHNYLSYNCTLSQTAALLVLRRSSFRVPCPALNVRKEDARDAPHPMPLYPPSIFERLPALSCSIFAQLTLVCTPVPEFSSPSCQLTAAVTRHKRTRISRACAVAGGLLQTPARKTGLTQSWAVADSGNRVRIAGGLGEGFWLLRCCD
jgi:uncharacterized membrane protein